MDELPTVVRLRVGKLMRERGMSTQDLVDLTGFTYNTALSLKRDNYGRMGMETLARLCEALGVQPGDVFELVDEEPDH